ncbi:diphthamide synthesis protein [Candidatus Woesearchaeota archaeon]|nr:diphthamide synthesis protein [Candidatus Woesearchaeota archaeon]
MRTIIQPVKRRVDPKGIERLIDELPEEFYMFTSSQYSYILKEIIGILEQHGKKVFLYKPKHSSKEGVITGCAIEKLDKPAIVISDGLFHGEALLLAGNNVVVINPISWSITKINKEKIERIHRHIEAMKKKLLEAREIGIIISLKPGQNWVKLGEEIEKKLREKGKNTYLFITNNIDLDRLIDYNFIDIWINTACPRIIDDVVERGINLINLRDVMSVIDHA